MTVVLGVDPGLGGGLAALDCNSLKIVGSIHMPTHLRNGKLVVDGGMVHQWVRDWNFRQAWVEAVSSRPRQAGQFGFGISVGVVHGVLWSCGIPWHLVAPAAWKRAYGLIDADSSTRQKKSASRSVASTMFPDYADAFRRVKDDGVAEACLIALWGHAKGGANAAT